MIIENTPIIITDRLILRKYTLDDLNAIFKILKDEQVNIFLPWFIIKNKDEAEEFLFDRFLKYYDKPSAYRYAICLKDDNIPIGYICVSNDDNNDLGYGIKKEFWSKGIITEAAFAVVGRIRNAGFPFITATHDINNPASGQVMKKIGMTYKYTYIEQWQPKDISVTFRMYQLNFDPENTETYMKYWYESKKHYIEQII